MPENSSDVSKTALLWEQIKHKLPGLILRINYADDSRKTWQTINKVTSREPNNLAINQLYYNGGKGDAVTIIVNGIAVSWTIWATGLRKLPRGIFWETSVKSHRHR